MNKKVVKEEERPHRVLEFMLEGPKVPEGFKCDGCSSSPDLHFVWACNIHDYESVMSSKNWELLTKECAKLGTPHKCSTVVVVGFQFWDKSLGVYRPINCTLKFGFQLWHRQFKGMSKRLKHNIEILSGWKFTEDGLVRRKFYDPKRFMGYRLSRLYANVTFKYFTNWAR